MTILTNMPVFLLGALATEITATVRVPAYGIGLAIGVYWASAALTSACTSVIGRVLNEKRMGVTALLLAVLSLAGSAAWIPWWPWLIMWAGLGGAGNGLGHPSSNHLLVTNVRASSRGLAFGVKQAAVPLAGLLAGASIPLIALTLGWPVAFLLMAALGVFVLIPTILVRATPSTGIVVRPAGRLEPRLRPSLVLMATMTMFAAGAANSAVAFSVTGALERGIALGPAGALLAAGSASGAITRIVIGRIVDRGQVSALLLIRTAVAACAAGLVLMAVPSSISYAVGFLLAAGLGWGWPGLVHLFVSHMAPGAAAGATGIVQTGSYIGSAIGPVLTGLVLSSGNSTLTWMMLATMAATAVAISFLVGRRLREIGLM
ncbi:MFS transporter [Kocuria turfanensis]|uniref:MFS transporter n=1 Tax=Kocuria turfanensis TaxID=388357 RepID=UPI004035DCE9